MAKKKVMLGDVVTDPKQVVAAEDVLQREMDKQGTSDALKAQAAAKDAEMAREEADRHAEALRTQAEETRERESNEKKRLRGVYDAYKDRNPVKAEMKKDELARKLSAAK